MAAEREREQADVVAFKDYNSAWLALVQGRVDALTGSMNILHGFAKNNPNYVILPVRFSVERWADEHAAARDDARG